MVDDSEGESVQSVISSLVNLERRKTGSCEVMISKMIQKLARFVCSDCFNPQFWFYLA